MISIVINNKHIQVKSGLTILQAVGHSYHIPTLCYHPKFKPRAVCRLCLVERNHHLVPACSTVVKDGDEIQTDSKEIKEFRKMDLQYLLNRHPNDCMSCEVNSKCQFQDLVWEQQVHDKFKLKHIRRGDESDKSSLSKKENFTSCSIQRDLSKCIECGLCVDACGEHGQQIHAIGFANRGSLMLPVTVFEKPLEDTNCISCGQCTVVCPTGAITERSDWRRVLEELDSQTRPIIVQTAPATRIAIGEEFGFASGTISTGRMIQALRQLGFTQVFDTNLGADMTIMEEATELLERIKNRTNAEKPLPMFTSCCPGWINLVEKSYPHIIPHLSTTKSPMQIHGRLSRLLYPNAFIVSIMPCTAKKGESQRPGLKGDVDAVLTTRELARLIRARKINFASLLNENQQYDSPLGNSTGAGQIFAATGGVMEACLRTIINLSGEKKDYNIEFTQVRGMDYFKVCEIPNIGKFGVINGIAMAQKLLNDNDSILFRDNFVAIEVMACVGGCLGGGGEPKSLDPDILHKRMASVYKIDLSSEKRRSYENPSVTELYDMFQATPGSNWSKMNLHTHYSQRNSKRDILSRFLDALDRRNGKEAAENFSSNGNWIISKTGHEDILLHGRNAIADFIVNNLRNTHTKHSFVDSSSLKVKATKEAEENVYEFSVKLDSKNLIHSLQKF